MDISKFLLKSMVMSFLIFMYKFLVRMIVLLFVRCLKNNNDIVLVMNCRIFKKNYKNNIPSQVQHWHYIF